MIDWKGWVHRWPMIVGTLVVLGVAVFGARQLVEPSVAVTPVVRRDVVQTVVASGRVVTPNRIDIGAQIVGRVRAVPVLEGQQVKSGQILVLIESKEAEAGVRTAEAAVAQAEARLRQMRELQLPVAAQTMRQAEANLANARSQHERNRSLFASGFIGKSALDDSERNVTVAQSQVDAARTQYETLKPSGSDYEMALRTLEQARTSLDAARARLAYATIAAPTEGTLIARDVEQGDVVQPGKTLMVLSPAGQTQLVIQIDERNLSRIHTGQSAVASADAYPQDRFSAELVYINPAVDPQRGTVEVKLDVREAPAYLRQDMTVSVDIETERRPAALALRTGDVHDALGDAPWVLAVVAGRAVRRPLKLGLRGEGWVEVTDGVGEGDLVVPATNTVVKPGQRIRTAPHA